eukprot:350618-Chlamydomonas_euryale.AAC.5
MYPFARVGYRKRHSRSLPRNSLVRVLSHEPVKTATALAAPASAATAAKFVLCSRSPCGRVVPSARRGGGREKCGGAARIFPLLNCSTAEGGQYDGSLLTDRTNAGRDCFAFATRRLPCRLTVHAQGHWAHTCAELRYLTSSASLSRRGLKARRSGCADARPPVNRVYVSMECVGGCGNGHAAAAPDAPPRASSAHRAACAKKFAVLSSGAPRRWQRVR